MSDVSACGVSMVGVAMVDRRGMEATLTGQSNRLGLILSILALTEAALSVVVHLCGEVVPLLVLRQHFPADLAIQRAASSLARLDMLRI